MRDPFSNHECKHCGEEFSSSYFRNMHEAEECPEVSGDE
jgi:hypothetical protein